MTSIIDANVCKDNHVINSGPTMTCIVDDNVSVVAMQLTQGLM